VDVGPRLQKQKVRNVLSNWQQMQDFMRGDLKIPISRPELSLELQPDLSNDWGVAHSRKVRSDPVREHLHWKDQTIVDHHAVIDADAFLQQQTVSGTDENIMILADLL